MERNRLGSTRDETARASLEAVIEFLESQVEDLNAQMADRPARCRSVQELESVRSNPELKSLDTLLQSVPGALPIMSATLLSSLPELGGTSSGAIAALVGVAPMNHDSGQAREDSVGEVRPWPERADPARNGDGEVWLFVLGPTNSPSD